MMTAWLITIILMGLLVVFITVSLLKELYDEIRRK